MYKIGFIGYGRMSRMILTGLIKAGSLGTGEVIISTRSQETIQDLPYDYPGIGIAPSNREIAISCRRILIGVRPLDLLPLLKELLPELREGTHIISIAAGVTLDEIGSIWKGPATRILPNIAVSVRSGVSLCCHNLKVGEQDADEIQALFSSIGEVVMIPEEAFDTGSDLMSCAPAFFSVFLEELAMAGERTGHLNRREALDLAKSAFTGTGALFRSGMNTGDIPPLVATPGGITEQGMQVLRESLPEIWDRVFERTQAKHEELGTCIRDQMRE